MDTKKPEVSSRQFWHFLTNLLSTIHYSYCFPVQSYKKSSDRKRNERMKMQKNHVNVCDIAGNIVPLQTIKKLFIIHYSPLWQTESIVYH